MGLQVDPKELKKRQFFLEGNIPKAVLSVCLPMALFQLINELFRVFDLVITSQINPESVSAVSFFNQLNNSIVSVGTGLSIGAGILIAGLYGAGEYERLKTTVNTTFFMAGAAALVLVAGLILGARPILRLANTPAQLVEIGLNYYRITALNLFFTFFNNVYIAIEKARGNGSKIMRINFAMALTKFSFSAFFVLVLHQGIVMIGVATLLSNLVVTAIGLYNLRNPEDVFGLSFRYVRLKNDIVKKIVSISLPVIAEKFSFSAGKVVVNSVGVNYGTQTVGALGVSNSVSALSTVPAGSIGDGGAALIRQNIGHGNPQRALKFFGVSYSRFCLGVWDSFDLGVSGSDPCEFLQRGCGLCRTDCTDLYSRNDLKRIFGDPFGSYGTVVCLWIYQIVLLCKFRKTLCFPDSDSPVLPALYNACGRSGDGFGDDDQQRHDWSACFGGRCGGAAQRIWSRLDEATTQYLNESDAKVECSTEERR